MPDAVGQRSIGTENQDVFQFLDRIPSISAARVNLRQKDLRLIELRGIQTLGGQEVLLSLIEPIELEVVHAELGVRESILGSVAHGALVKRQRVRGSLLLQRGFL